MLRKSLMIGFDKTLGFVTVENNGMSSANNFAFEERLSYRSLI